jgi:hypothetical protein
MERLDRHWKKAAVKELSFFQSASIRCSKMHIPSNISEGDSVLFSQQKALKTKNPASGKPKAGTCSYNCNQGKTTFTVEG